MTTQAPAQDATPNRAPKRDLAVSARIPRGLREAVMRAGVTYAAGRRPPMRAGDPTFNALVNVALVRFVREFPPAVPEAPGDQQ